MTPDQIRKVIRKRLADGTYGPGTVLPSEQALSVEFGVRAWAVRWALQPLKDDGHLHFAPGRGNLVLDPQSPAPVGCGIRDIEQAVRSRLGDGTYAVGTWLPTMRHLAAEFKVGPTSIHKALTPLKRDKLVAAATSPPGLYVIDPHHPGAPPPGKTPRHAAHIERVLRERLLEGICPPGSRLPTNGELSAEFRVSPNTISKAVKPLRHQGLVVQGPDLRLYAARPTSEPPAPVRNAPRESVSCDAATTSEQDHQ